MTIPQFKKLSANDRQAVISAYSKLMAPAESDRGMIRAVRPRVPTKGEHMPITREIKLGQELLAIKAKLPHGRFRQQVEDKSGITWTQANRFVLLAKAKAAEAAQRDRQQPGPQSGYSAPPVEYGASCGMIIKLLVAAALLAFGTIA